MAEQTVLVCDVCGQPSRQTVNLRVGDRNLLKDLCETHLAELLKGTRRPRRGRRPGSKTSTAKKATTARRRTAAKSTAPRARRRTRRASSPAAESPASG